MKRVPVTAAAVFLFITTTAFSAETIKPGLWEITTQMQGGGSGHMTQAMAEMQKAMADMSPEQRKMMQDMMAKQGVQMGAASGGGMAVKVCMTQEMIDRNDMGTQQGDCTHTTTPRMGSSMKYSFSCTKPPSSGEGEVRFNSRESYSTKMAMTTTVKGKPEKMDMQGSGKWLGADCGNIKPVGIPKK
jgi:hypothetical protein